jgi:hypothetical protein
VDGHVCGSGAIEHREFAMASGEMREDEFTGFLNETLELAALHGRDACRRPRHWLRSAQRVYLG